MLLFAVMIIFIVVFGIFVPEAVGFADVDVLLFATAVIVPVISVVVILPDAAAPADIVVLLFAAMIVVIVVFVVIVLDAKSSSVVVTSVVETARVQRHTGAAFCVRQRLSDLLPFVSSRYFRYPKELPLELK